METANKPILIYEGDCGFCRHWVRRWRHLTGERVDYAPYEEVGARFPQIPKGEFAQSVQLVEPDGSIYRGAEAVFRTLAHSPGKGWPFWIYRNIPGVAPVSERVYATVAHHREGLNEVNRWLWGTDFEFYPCILTRRLFLGGLGFIYLIAFLSLSVQVEGLFGSHGIAPVKEALESIREGGDPVSFLNFPTLFWFDSSDAFLRMSCLAGAGVSILLIGNIFPAGCLFVLDLLYLSFLVVGDRFMAYQWDTLLLEVGFLAIFFAPWKIRPRLKDEPPPSTVVLWLIRFLLFKLMFSSGLVKVLSGDQSWTELQALEFHFETQPLPTWIGWYFHQIPFSIHQLFVFCVFLIQLVVPIFIFLPRRFRLRVFQIFVFFQVLIQLTGNYGFFNLLTIVLCLSLLDDGYVKKWFPARWGEVSLIEKGRGREPRGKNVGVGITAVVVLVVSIFVQMVPLVFWDYKWPGWANAAYRQIKSFHIVNRYGLFAWMTTTRPEIMIEGSRDGQEWKTYVFKWKPGDPGRVPAFVAPHQPRLDWQMWFAALGNYRRNPWLIRTMVQLLNGSPPVLALLETNPFPGSPPKYMRAVVYDYRFTNFEERNETGNWWKRIPTGNYTPVIQLP
ncbi:MAG: hypothetical protein COV67_14445 [Nitrospinae bacterium CG11_big_fil_rev_8_21_14_0_20_56_8]|nr:MAG: hypothetical protein COV67_14445 [Nitrospinae bacterium CG11_big_fil_rev_8_21_14_0_20_56_8]